MKPLPPDFLEKSRAVFLQNAEITLAEVRQQVLLLPATTARRDGLSALDAIPRKLRKPMGEIPATMAAVQALFANHNGPQLGLSQKTFQNLRAQVRRLVETYGIPAPSFTNRINLTEEWQSLIVRVKGPDYASGLRRLA